MTPQVRADHQGGAGRLFPGRPAEGTDLLEPLLLRFVGVDELEREFLPPAVLDRVGPVVQQLLVAFDDEAGREAFDEPLGFRPADEG
jgi:hypothetical protein